MLSALRPSLEALTRPERFLAAANSSDKAELAAAAEAVAGILASGAPWAPAAEGGGGGGGDGGWAVAALGAALRGTSLDMADAWAVAYRCVAMRVREQSSVLSPHQAPAPVPAHPSTASLLAPY